MSVSSFSFVNNPVFNLTLMRPWCHMATNRAVSAVFHTPQLGGHAATGAQYSDPSPLSHPKKASTPPTSQIEIWSTGNQWSWGTLWKKSAYTLQLIWAHLKARYLHIETAVRGPNSLQKLFLNSISLQKAIFKHYRVSWWAVLHTIFEIQGTRRDSKIHEVSRQYKNGGTKPTKVFMDRHGWIWNAVGWISG